MSGFEIASLDLREGQMGISQMPGRDGDYGADLTALLDWAPDLVLSMTTQSEMERKSAWRLGPDLEAEGVAWRHLPIRDFGVPGSETAALWAEASGLAHDILRRGGRVLVHCMGGCGRSGMAFLRLMLEADEKPVLAIARLREIRPCAVETAAQKEWALRRDQA